MIDNRYIEHYFKYHPPETTKRIELHKENNENCQLLFKNTLILLNFLFGGFLDKEESKFYKENLTISDAKYKIDKSVSEIKTYIDEKIKDGFSKEFARKNLDNFKKEINDVFFKKYISTKTFYNLLEYVQITRMAINQGITIDEVKEYF